MDFAFPTEKKDLLARYPHLRDIQDINHERFMRLSGQNKKIPTGKNPALMANIRAHLKKHFPGQQFSVREHNLYVSVSWTKWEEPLDSSPDPKEVNEVLEWFRNWPSDTTCNESRQAAAFRKLFINTFGGTHRFDYQVKQPTPDQIARKKKAKLGKIAKGAQTRTQSKIKPSSMRAAKM